MRGMDAGLTGFGRYHFLGFGLCVIDLLRMYRLRLFGHAFAAQAASFISWS